MANKTVTLYRANIYSREGKVTISKGAFVETSKQFKSAGTYKFIVPKNGDGSPGNGYARMPEEAVQHLKAGFEQRADKLRNELAEVQKCLNIIQGGEPVRIAAIQKSGPVDVT